MNDIRRVDVALGVISSDGAAKELCSNEHRRGCCFSYTLGQLYSTQYGSLIRKLVSPSQGQSHRPSYR